MLDTMYLFILEQSACGDPWQFYGVFSSHRIAEETLISHYGDDIPACLPDYRLFRVKCDNGLWADQTPIEWSPSLKNNAKYPPGFDDSRC